MYTEMDHYAIRVGSYWRAKQCTPVSKSAFFFACSHCNDMEICAM